MNKDLEQYFRDEAQDLLLQINNILRSSLSREMDTDVLQAVRRYVHTLKGSAHIAQRQDIAQCAHQLEDVIDQVAIEGDFSEGIARIIRSTDRIAELVSRSPAGNGDTGEASQRNGRERDGSQEAVTIHVELKQIDRILSEMAAGNDALNRLQSLISQCEGLKNLFDRPEQRRGIELNSLAPTQQLLESIRKQVSALAYDLGLVSETLDRNQEVLRGTVQGLRLVPASAMFIFVERAARAAAEATGKQIEFETAGGEIELDADVLFQVKDALVQIARNAVVHGVEDITTRRGAGKTASGKVRLLVRRHGRRITFSVSDDGAGIDQKKLYDHAVARGWLSKEAAESAELRDLSWLILQPGFTTSSSVTTMAGRGVGLDLVWHVVTSLKGSIRITSRPGHGTDVEMEVPSTVTLLSMLLAEADSAKVGVPADSVEAVYVLSTLPSINGQYIVDGTAMPFATLAPYLTARKTPPRFGIKIGTEERYLLGVDKVDGIEEILVRQLPDFIAAERYVVGISADSSDSLRLIIDPGIFRATLPEIPSLPSVAPSPQPPVLIIDDSPTTRMLEQSILTAAGYRVELASSAEEALQLARQRSFGLFVVDLEMPGMDGLTFISQARESAALRNIPAIVLTSRNSDDDRKRASDAGAKDYFSKTTFDQKVLLRRVAELLGRK